MPSPVRRDAQILDGHVDAAARQLMPSPAPGAMTTRWRAADVVAVQVKPCDRDVS